MTNVFVIKVFFVSTTLLLLLSLLLKQTILIDYKTIYESIALPTIIVQEATVR